MEQIPKEQKSVKRILWNSITLNFQEKLICNLFRRTLTGHKFAFVY